MTTSPHLGIPITGPSSDSLVQEALKKLVHKMTENHPVLILQWQLRDVSVPFGHGSQCWDPGTVHMPPGWICDKNEQAQAM